MVQRGNKCVPGQQAMNRVGGVRIFQINGFHPVFVDLAVASSAVVEERHGRGYTLGCLLPQIDRQNKPDHRTTENQTHDGQTAAGSAFMTGLNQNLRDVRQRHGAVQGSELVLAASEAGCQLETPLPLPFSSCYTTPGGLRSTL